MAGELDAAMIASHDELDEGKATLRKSFPEVCVELRALAVESRNENTRLKACRYIADVVLKLEELNSPLAKFLTEIESFANREE